MKEKMFEVECDHRFSLELIGEFYDTEKEKFYKEYSCKMCGKNIKHYQR